VLTLFTTPVIYLFFDRLGARFGARRRRFGARRGEPVNEHFRAFIAGRSRRRC
jgi:hypothetical protein